MTKLQKNLIKWVSPIFLTLGEFAICCYNPALGAAIMTTFFAVCAFSGLFLGFSIFCMEWVARGQLTEDEYHMVKIFFLSDDECKYVKQKLDSTPVPFWCRLFWKTWEDYFG